MKNIDTKATLHIVHVRDQRVEVIVSQSSATVWTADGAIEGRSIEGRGASSNAALNHWRRQADRHEAL